MKLPGKVLCLSFQPIDLLINLITGQKSLKLDEYEWALNKQFQHKFKCPNTTGSTGEIHYYITLISLTQYVHFVMERSPKMYGNGIMNS